MTRLVWDKRDYELGLERGVFYPQNGPGEAWNGLISVGESPSGADERARYFDGQKLPRLRNKEEFSGTIQAFTYPDSFYENVLVRKRRQSFGLSYRVGNKIHIVYNISVDPTAYNYQQNELDSFSWEFTTKPVPVPDAKPSAHLIIDTTQTYLWTVTALEEVLYGSDTKTARLPLPAEVFDIFEANALLKVVDHGDGTFTVTGPDEAIQMLDSTTFQITWPSAIFIDEVSYTLRSH